MWRGWSAWAWAWVWVGAGLPYLILTHSTSSDPHLNPGKAAALLTSLRQQVSPGPSPDPFLAAQHGSAGSAWL